MPSRRARWSGRRAVTSSSLLPTRRRRRTLPATGCTASARWAQASHPTNEPRLCDAIPLMSAPPTGCTASARWAQGAAAPSAAISAWSDSWSELTEHERETGRNDSESMRWKTVSHGDGWHQQQASVVKRVQVEMVRERSGTHLDGGPHISYMIRVSRRTRYVRYYTCTLERCPTGSSRQTVQPRSKI